MQIKSYGRILAAALLLTLMLQVLSSCQLNSLIRGDKLPFENGSQGSDTESVSKNNESEENAPNTGGTPTDPLFFSSLTGMTTDEKASLARPLLFVIGNTESALPQSGLSKAEVLFEVPMEDGSTRILAVTTSYADAKKIGSLRAAAPYYSDIAGFFDAVLVHTGNADGSKGQEPVGVDVLSAAVQSTGFYKENGCAFPHNLFTTPTRLGNLLRMAGYRTENRDSLPYFRFHSEGGALALVGTPATHIRINFSETHRTEFRYQNASGLYKRYQNGMVQSDAEDGTPLTAKNVFILYANSTLTENASGSSLTLAMDNGSGIYATNGAYIPILWYKNSDGALVFIRESDGAILEQNPGITHIEFVKSSQKGDVTLDSN